MAAQRAVPGRSLFQLQHLLIVVRPVKANRDHFIGVGIELSEDVRMPWLRVSLSQQGSEPVCCELLLKLALATLPRLLSRQSWGSRTQGTFVPRLDTSAKAAGSAAAARGRSIVRGSWHLRRNELTPKRSPAGAAPAGCEVPAANAPVESEEEVIPSAFPKAGTSFPA